MFRKKRRLARLFWLAALIFLAVSVYRSNCIISPEEYSVSGAPEAFSGFKIVQISDLHAREHGEGHEKLLSAVAAQGPDIIAITGDLIDGDNQLEIVTPLLREFRALAPVYYVTGNHEYATELSALYGLMEQLDVTVLNNDWLVLERDGARMVLAGVEDPNGDINMKTPETLLAEIRAAEGEDVFVTLLAHRYDLAEHYAQAGADLTLVGHAHGGMLRLPFTDGLVGPGHDFLPEHTSGLYTLDNGAQLVASRGLSGVGGIPRLFNPLHLPVILFE